MIFFIDEMQNLRTLRKFIVVQQILTKKKVMYWGNYKYF
jgi:hypothetical protein